MNNQTNLFGKEIKEISYQDKINEIVAYLNKTCNTNYRSKSQYTRKKIITRLKEGFEIKDFKRVIKNMAEKWLNDPVMERYLRPETLFSTKFESYLNVKKEKQRISDRWHCSVCGRKYSNLIDNKCWDCYEN